MRILFVFARAYPARSAIMLVCLLLAGVAEGVGLSSLLPLLTLATRETGAPADAGSALERQVHAALAAVGLEPRIEVLLGVILAGMTAKAGLVLLANRQVGYTVAHVATDLRLSLLRALLATRWSYYVHQPIGAFANAVASEAQRASQAYLHGATILAQLVEACVYVGVALAVSTPATFAAIGASLVIAGLLGRLVRTGRRAGHRQTVVSKTLLTRLTDVLQAVKPLKAMARERLIGPLLERETERLNRALQREVWSQEALRALQEPLMVGFLALGLYVALVQLSLPLATVTVLAFLFGRITTTFGKVQRQLHRMVSCESAYDQLAAMIRGAEAVVEPPGGRRVARLARGLRLQGVAFSYGEREVLRDVTLEIPAGEITAVVGRSGAGKTTLADLVLGLAHPTRGEVLVDDVPLAECDLRAWREQVGYVPQEMFLLHESVALNVSLGDPAVGRDDVERALQEAGAADFVAALPEGVDTVVGERGARLSGGQRQRIAIARALVRRPALLVLDEATASLDPETEAALCDTFAKLRGRVTVLAISHQPAIVARADRIYRVADGRVGPASRDSLSAAEIESAADARTEVGA